ncbi:nucleotide disphospho-sugar-binding domain-containing protein [Streptomyces sp. NPDC048659]|uniref:nucleotide disphospho-sugar-binding domain-containing protein n=1 Tax=Streptomyces sp. NPDC048659 TaxID=3155489 RepID=UPI00341631EF
MSRILVAATPVAGHHAPLLQIARHLSGLGHEVVFLGGSRFAAQVEAAGPAFRALPAEADYDDRDLPARFPGRAAVPAGPAQVLWDVKHIFGDPVPAQLAALREALAAFPASVVIHDNLFLGGVALSLGAEPGDRPAVFGVGISPLGVDSRDTAPHLLGLLPPADEAERARYAELAATMAERAVPLMEHLRGCFAAAGVTLGEGSLIRHRVQSADLFLQLTVAGFEYPRSDLPGNVRFVGAIPIEGGSGTGTASGAATGNTPQAPAWWPELARARAEGRRVVVVTQGTLANTALGRLVVPALRALADRPDVLVVAATGRPDAAERIAAELPELPANARVAGFVPFAELLPLADLLVTNGGYGGTQAALAHGVPLVVGGDTEDKPEVAARVEWSGTGVNLRTADPSDEELRAAVDSVLSTPSYRERAAALAEEYAAHDALALIDGLVREAAGPGSGPAAPGPAGTVSDRSDLAKLR